MLMHLIRGIAQNAGAGDGHFSQNRIEFPRHEHRCRKSDKLPGNPDGGVRDDLENIQIKRGLALKKFLFRISRTRLKIRYACQGDLLSAHRFFREMTFHTVHDGNTAVHFAISGQACVFSNTPDMFGEILSSFDP